MIGLTGASGFVGREIVRQAASHGSRIHALVRSGRPLPSGVFSSEVADLNHPLPAGAFVGCHSVIHCAARAHVMRETAIDPQAAYLETNRDAAISVAEAAASAGVQRLVFVSSIKVLGEQTQPGHPFRPDDSPDPVDGYGVSKAAAERELRAVAARTGMELVIVRPPLVHGPGARGNLAALIRAVRWRIPLPFGAIDNRRALIHVTNLAELLLQVTRAAKAPGRILHLTDGEALSTPEMIVAIASGLGVRPHLLRVAPERLLALTKLIGQEERIRRLVESLEVDDSETRKLLAWRPTIGSAEGLRQMAAASLQR